MLRALPTNSYAESCRTIQSIQGEGNVWYCGAHVHALGEGAIPSLWHENAFRSGINAAQAIHETSAKELHV